jgi:hypothetical protein
MRLRAPAQSLARHSLYGRPRAPLGRRAFALWLVLSTVPAAGVPAQHRAGPPVPEVAPVATRFCGERLAYEVSVLFFRRAAVSQLSLEPAAEAGRYLARLSVETKGFARLLERRRHVYTSLLAPCDGGRRWCPGRFVSDLTGADRREVTTVDVDPVRGLITRTTERGGAITEIDRAPVQPGAHYDDLLSAFYNLRAGVYGPVERGRRYEIATVPMDGTTHLTARVLAGKDEAQARRKYRMGDEGFVVAVGARKGTSREEGELVVWFSADLVPLGATVRNYAGFGSMQGRLVGAARPAGSPEPEGPPEAATAAEPPPPAS